jgi:hypothetical protein
VDQFAKRLVGVHEGKAERVRDVLLRHRNFERPRRVKRNGGAPLGDEGDQIGGAL